MPFSPSSPVSKLKWTRHAPGVPQPRANTTEPVHSASADRAPNLFPRASSGKSLNAADEISIGPSAPRTVARTLRICTVPITFGKENPAGVPDAFPAHDPPDRKSVV